MIQSNRVFVCLLVGMASMFALGLYADRGADAQVVAGDGLNGLVGSQNEYVRLNPTLLPHPNGGYMAYGNPAAYSWHPGTKAPERPDGAIDPATGKRIPRWPMVAVPATGYPGTVYYWEGWFRTASGQRVAPPLRWAYLRLEPEVWNPVTKGFDIPGLTVPPLPPSPPGTDKPGVHMDDIAGQQFVDILKRSFTVDRINRFMEASPYDEPDTGAPEDGPGAPPL